LICRHRLAPHEGRRFPLSRFLLRCKIFSSLILGLFLFTGRENCCLFVRFDLSVVDLDSGLIWWPWSHGLRLWLHLLAVTYCASLLKPLKLLPHPIPAGH
jgi:hypothetical protein